MPMTTVFLAILVVALVFGNLLLFLLSRKSKPSAQRQLQLPSRFSRADDGSARNNTPNLKPLEFKIDLAHRRLQDLEASFAALKASGSADNGLARRLEKLDSFKSTAEAELVAIKEILAELQGNGVTVKARTYRNGPKGKGLSQGDLHKLVYRSSAD